MILEVNFKSPGGREPMLISTMIDLRRAFFREIYPSTNNHNLEENEN